MKVRKGRKKDIAGCVEIAKGLEEYFHESALDYIREDLKKQYFYVIEDGKILGFISLNIKSDICAEISWLAVRDEKRDMGLGKVLMDRSEEFFSDRGIKLIEVKTFSEKEDYEPYEQTRKFYENKGFIHLETVYPYLEWDGDKLCDIYVKIL